MAPYWKPICCEIRLGDGQGTKDALIQARPIPTVFVLGLALWSEAIIPCQGLEYGMLRFCLL